MEIIGLGLLLRPFASEDFSAVHAFASDPRVTRYTDWGPNDEASTRTFLRDACEPRTLADDDFTFAVTRQEGGEVIGSAAVWVESRSHGRAEFGYAIAAAEWRRGYGTEVARLVVDFAFDRLKMFRVAATCHPDNVGSIAVLEKAGLVREGRMRDHMLVRGTRRDSLLFSTTKSDRR